MAIFNELPGLAQVALVEKQRIVSAEAVAHFN